MFVKLTRINQSNHEKEIVLNTDEIEFVTAIETEEELFLVAFKNGMHPQFINKENYDKLVEILLK